MILKEEMKKTGPRDVFFQLLSIITLYISAISFGTLLFQHINIYFPDPLADAGYGYHPARGPLRFALATLVVVFPVLVWVSRFLIREIGQAPEKGELRIRKWLLNFTLFATAIIIIGDLVALVNRYLEGELTVRFILKICVILLIAAVIFRYYLWNLKTRGTVNNLAMKLLVRATIALVAVSTIAGFFLAGSPQAERLRRFDERRVGDLQGIQWQIVSFWQQKNGLPQTLDDLRDSISGYEAPLDPQDGTPYEYRVLGDLQFELCATFKTDSATSMNAKTMYARSPRPAHPPGVPIPAGPYGETFDNWAHGAGRTCFDRTIDPERYGTEPGFGPVKALR